MSTDFVAAGMPSEHDPKKVLWGKQGLGSDFFGPELIAEAVWEVIRTSNRRKLRNQSSFMGAFIEQNFRFEWRLDSTIRSYPFSKLELPEGVTEWDLERVWSMGYCHERYGMIERVLPGEGTETQWSDSKWWHMICCYNDDRRKVEPHRMPEVQIAYMNNRRLFLTSSGKLLVCWIDYHATELQPDRYMPSFFAVEKIDLLQVYQVSQSGLLEFCKEQGAEAGVGLLQGYNLQLRSSNHQLREELAENEKAEMMAKELLTRINL